MLALAFTFVSGFSCGVMFAVWIMRTAPLCDEDEKVIDIKDENGQNDL